MRVQTSEKSGPRPAWLFFLVALSLVITTVWFREGASGPIHRTRSGIQAALAPASAAGEYVTRPARGMIAWMGDLGVSRSTLEQLRSQNRRLRARIAELEEARLENERLTALVGMTKAAERESLGAHVIGRPTNSWEGVITIDRGTSDGVTVGMPVIGGEGLLGQTIEVSINTAKVRLITDQRSGVAALVQRTRTSGIVHGTIEGGLTMDFVSAETTLKVGDVVITSGLGGVYPKGVVIGEVVASDRTANAMYRDIAVEPMGDLASLEEVLVLIGASEISAPEGGE